MFKKANNVVSFFRNKTEKLKKDIKVFSNNHIIAEDPDQIVKYYFKIDENARHMAPGGHQYYCKSFNRKDAPVEPGLSIMQLSSRMWGVTASGRVEVIKSVFDGEHYTVTDKEELKRFRWIQLAAVHV